MVGRNGQGPNKLSPDLMLLVVSSRNQATEYPKPSQFYNRVF